MDQENISGEEMLELFAIKNSDGQYFRAKGYCGYGKTWVDELKKARIWTKIGVARAQVTFFAKNYPQYPAPKLLRLKVTEIEEVDEVDRVKQALNKAELAEARARERRNKSALERAQQDLERVQKKIKSLSSS